MNPTVRLSMENYSIHYHIIWCCTDLQPWLKLGCSLTSKTTFVKSHAGKETTKFMVLVRNRLFGAISPFLYCLKSLHQCTAAAYDEGEFSEHWVIFMLRLSNQHAELKHTVLKIKRKCPPFQPMRTQAGYFHRPPLPPPPPPHLLSGNPSLASTRRKGPHGPSAANQELREPHRCRAIFILLLLLLLLRIW